MLIVYTVCSAQYIRVATESEHTSNNTSEQRDSPRTDQREFARLATHSEHTPENI